MQHLGSTNGQALKWDGIECDPERLNFFYNLVKKRYTALSQGIAQSDPIKVFVKQEPHKNSKILEGRFRLISAVSVVDSMVDRILFQELMRECVASATQTPCMVGWTPMNGGYKILPRVFSGKSVMCLDKTAWDWTVGPWLITLWKRTIKRLAFGASEEWNRIVDLRFKCLFETAVFQFQDGTVVNQPVIGIMKSGCYLTILLNSLGQSLLHYVIMARLGLDTTLAQPYAVGDDTVQDVMPNELLEPYLREMRNLGIIPKDPQIRKEIDFAGHIMTSSYSVPAYLKKHLYNLYHLDETYAVETLQSYQLEYAFDDQMLEYLQGLLYRRDKSKIKSPLYLRLKYNGAG